MPEERRNRPALGWSLAWKRVMIDTRDDLLPDPMTMQTTNTTQAR